MAKTHSGGGKTPTKQTTRLGSPASGVDPGAAARIGLKTAYDFGTAPQGRPTSIPLGNEVAKNVGRGGPGTGRVVHARGSQGTHGAVDPGQSPASRGPTTVGSKPMADPFIDRGSKQ
jgi:hypothetical protein